MSSHFSTMISTMISKCFFCGSLCSRWCGRCAEEADAVEAGDSPLHEFVSDAYQNPTLSKDLKEVQEGIKRLGAAKKRNGTFSDERSGHPVKGIPKKKIDSVCFKNIPSS